MFTDEVKLKTKSYDVCVNPALECLGVLFVLAGFELNKARSNEDYLESIKTRFKNYQNHQAVILLKKLVDNELFKYNGPVELFLRIYHNNSINRNFFKRFNLNKQLLQQFLNKLNDFVKETNFNEFFARNRQFYDEEAKRFVLELIDYNPIEYLLDFLKLKSKKLSVVLMFGVTSANYGIEISRKAYCCVRPYKFSRFQGIDFSYNKPYITTLLLHEFAHTFINPLTKKYKTKIANIDKEKFKDCFANNPYGEDLETVINEHIIRGIECLYIKDIFAHEFADFVDDYSKEGFICLKDLLNLYDKYLNNQEIYSNFSDFYPEIIEYFLKF